VTNLYSSNVTLVSEDDLHNSTDLHLLVPADLACTNCSLPDPKTAGESLRLTIKMGGFPTDTQIYWRVRVDDNLDPKKTKWSQSNIASSYLVDKTPPTTTMAPTTPRSKGTMTRESSSLLCIFAAVIWFLYN